MPKLVLEGQGEVEAEEGMTLLEACDLAGLPMETECGGFAACNSCRVRVVRGAENLSELAVEEEPFLDEEGQRLGCQARLLGDVVVVADPGM